MAADKRAQSLGPDVDDVGGGGDTMIAVPIRNISAALSVSARKNRRTLRLRNCWSHTHKHTQKGCGGFFGHACANKLRNSVFGIRYLFPALIRNGHNKAQNACVHAYANHDSRYSFCGGPPAAAAAAAASCASVLVYEARVYAYTRTKRLHLETYIKFSVFVVVVAVGSYGGASV